MILGVVMVADVQANEPVSKNPQYVIHVKQGNKDLGMIVLKLWPDIAPKHCAFFEARVAEGLYNGTAFHRVIPGFMIQGGDPNSIDGARATWGGGGSQTKVVAEFNKKSHVRGVLSAARTNDPNSFSGQFFVCVADATFLDGQYTGFGEVVAGMEVADVVVNSARDSNDNPLEKITMTIEKKK
ncbi:MAG: peptidylprolyl isomerase [Ignavibacteria bacterium]|nr:peptidylprolyl isomerase [Ignavibacteria bacterium]